MKIKSLFISILFTITSCSVIVPNNIKYITDDIPEFHKFKNNYQHTKNKSEPYFGDISIKFKTNLIKRISPNINTNKEIAFSIKSKDSIIERKKKFLLGNLSSNKSISIFDSNNSNLFSSSLKPYEGEVKIGNNNFGVAIIDNIPSVFSIGVLSIKIRDASQINLQKVLEKYNATLIDSSERDGKLYANIKIDLDKVDLSKLEELIYMSNSYNQVSLKNLEISSLNTAKTLVCLLDMLVNSSDLVELAGVDTLVSSQGRSISPISNQISTDENRSESYDTTDNSSNYSITRNGLKITKTTPTTSIDSWWLSSFLSEDNKKSTDIVKAWEYSAGNQVNIAIIDQEFGHMDKYSDFKDRLTFNNSWITDSDDKKRCNHGFKATSLIGAESDDFLNISGVANKSNIIPISRGKGSSSLNTALENIITYNDNNPTKRISIINISSTFSIGTLALLKSKIPSSNCIRPIFTYDSPSEVCDTDAVKMQENIKKLSNTKTLIDGYTNPSYDPNKESVIVVSAVANQGINGVKEGGVYSNTENKNAIHLFQFPSSLSNVIGVGAYEMNDVDKGRFIRADFGKSRETTGDLSFPQDYDNLMIASNYGDNVDVWAPGDNIPIHLPAERDYVDNIHDPITNELRSSEDVDFFALYTNEHKTVDRTQGTSFASPIVAGVAAMLKFWKPDLTVKQFATILNETGSIVTDPSFLDSANKGQRFLNALEAVQYEGINAQKYQVIKGTYTNNQIHTNDKVYSFTPNNPFLYSDLAGKSVTVLGWIKGDEINILQMREANQTLSYNGKAIPIVQPYGQTVVSTGDKIALPLPSDVIERLQSIAFYSEGIRYTDYDVVSQYAILGVPPNLSTARQNIIAKELSTGNTILTFEQALYRAALAMNLNPVTPPDALMLPDSELYPQFILDNVTLNSNPGDIVAAALYGLSKNDNVTVTIDGQNMPIYDQKDGYISFKIQGNLSGIHDVKISNQYDTVVYNKSLNISGNNKIAFYETDNNYKYQVYTINPDGTDLTKLTDTYGKEPVWSLDKSKIAYSSNCDIYIMNQDGTNKSKITNATNSDCYGLPIWSYDSKKLAYINYSYEQYIKVINTDGTNETTLIQLPENLYMYSTDQFAFSHDGSKLAYIDYDRGIYIINSDATNHYKVIDSVGAYDLNWSKDDTQLIYVDDSYMSGKIKKVNIDGSNIVTLADGLYAETNLEGDKIAYITYNDPNIIDIYTMNIDGSNKLNLTNSTSWTSMDSISWSLDSKHILYEGFDNYYIVKADGSGKSVLPLSLDGMIAQKWTIKSYKDKKFKNKRKNISF